MSLSTTISRLLGGYGGRTIVRSAFAGSFGFLSSCSGFLP